MSQMASLGHNELIGLPSLKTVLTKKTRFPVLFQIEMIIVSDAYCKYFYHTAMLLYGLLKAPNLVSWGVESPAWGKSGYHWPLLASVKYGHKKININWNGKH